MIIFTSNSVSIPFINILRNRFDIEEIVTNNEKIVKYAQKLHINALRNPDKLLGNSYDLGFSISNQFILREKHLKSFKNGIINFHAAPISRYRGSATPIFYILEDDNNKWGYTYHMISLELDKGDIIEEVEFDLPMNCSSGDIDRLTVERALNDFPAFINRISKLDNLTPQKNNIKIWSRKEIDRYIRALDWPEVTEHLQVRLVPENTYQRMLKIYREHKDDNISGSRDKS